MVFAPWLLASDANSRDMIGASAPALFTVNARIDCGRQRRNKTSERHKAPIERPGRVPAALPINWSRFIFTKRPNFAPKFLEILDANILLLYPRLKRPAKPLSGTMMSLSPVVV